MNKILYAFYIFFRIPSLYLLSNFVIWDKMLYSDVIFFDLECKFCIREL